MKEKKDKNGKTYWEITDEDLKELKEANAINGYYLGDNGEKIIPPLNCKHELIIERGMPRNFISCKHCIFWQFTMKYEIDEEVIAFQKRLNRQQKKEYNRYQKFLKNKSEVKK